MRPTSIQRAVARSRVRGRRAGSRCRAGVRPSALAGLLLLLCAWPMAGCGGGRTGHDDASPAAAGPVADARRAPVPVTGSGAAAPAASTGATAGALDVTVTWDDAPPQVRRSPGLDACGATRSAPVQVHTLGGVAGAVVYLRGSDAQARAREPSAAVLAVRLCRAWPRVVLAQPGQALAVINDDERRLDLRVHRLPLPADTAQPGASQADGPELAASIALPVVGSRVDLRWPQPGVYRVAAADTQPGFVFVSDIAHAAVTDPVGRVQLAPLPPGSYDVTVWHPPVDDSGAPIIERASVTIVAGETSRSTIPLTMR